MVAVASAASARAATPESDAAQGPEVAGVLRLGYGAGGGSLSVPLNGGGVESVSGGGGAALSVGGVVTPFWPRPAVGLGAGAELGWKHDATGLSNPDLTLDRFPLVVSAHALVRMSPRAFLLAGGGIEKDFHVEFEAHGGPGGDRSMPLTSGLGAMVQVGGVLALSNGLACDLLLRYTRMSYEDGALDASNIALSVGLRFGR
jgi:hypothetical protein